MDAQEQIEKALIIQFEMVKGITETALKYIENREDKLRFLNDCKTITEYCKLKTEVIQ